jgi:hypothetical protein
MRLTYLALAAPLVVSVTFHVFAEAHTDEEREDTFWRCGTEAVSTCLRRPPWRLKTYVVSCDAPNPVAETVTGALGVEPQVGSIRTIPSTYIVSLIQRCRRGLWQLSHH